MTVRADGVRAAPTVRAGGLDVVLVEDDVRLADIVARTLRVDGARVECHGVAETALARCRVQPPDLLVLDLELPEMSGFEVARQLRGDVVTARVPILIASGHRDASTRIAAYAAGADCVLGKPFELSELRAAVASLATRGRALQDVESGWDVLLALAEIVDLRCMDARGHMERCARLGRTFGAVLGLPERDLLALERAGYLHDIGKVGVPHEVLNKPGKLTADERRVMQQHPQIGARICERLTTLERVVPVIRHHHERWDGSGYPDGLRGEETPLLARVFQVIDVFEALISSRCYKPAMPPEEALEVLRRETAQGAWDPSLVEAFRRALCEGGLRAACDPVTRS